MVLVVLCAVLLGAALTTWYLRGYALRRRVLDVPNERSSHAVPTPRGGGLAIAIWALSGGAVLTITGAFPATVFLAMACGGGAIAGIGWLDDHRDVPARLRFAVHVCAAVVAVALLGGAPELMFGEMSVGKGVVGYVLTAVGLVWFTNLFNFMDGIDGIAGSEVLSAGGAAALLAWWSSEPGVAAWFGVLAAASAGFLIWNWPPARIFMGDVGSGFLGFVLSATLLWSANVGAAPLWSGLILTAVFWVDATLTLVRRVLSGERWYEAHRAHGYQRAARYLGNHRAVTLTVLVINCMWLFPLAWAAQWRPGWGFPLLMIAVAPLALLGLALGAGRPGDIRQRRGDRIDD